MKLSESRSIDRARSAPEAALSGPPLQASPLRLPAIAIPALCGLALLAGCHAKDSFDGPERPRPNIVLIVADDLGWGDLGCYGQPRIDTPHLDRLAAEGMLFRRFYAGSTVCAPSRSALLTGQHTGHTGHTRIRGNKRQELLPEDVTVAEILRAEGYRTACFGKWGVGTAEGSGSPTRQGFERFFGYIDQRHAHNYYPSFLVDLDAPDDASPLRALPNVLRQENADGSGVAEEKVVYSHDLITDEALAWVGEQKRRQPFFLNLTWTLPHANNEAGAEGMEVPELGRYADEDWPEPAKGFAAMVTRMDRDVGRLRAQLEEQGLADNTLILFTSDNGPHSEGGHRSWFFNSSGPLKGQKRDLTEGGIRVPLIAYWPDHVPPNTQSDHVGAFWDLLPTLAELAGAGNEVPKDVDGLSFAPTLLGQHLLQPEHADLYWAFYEQGAARALLHNGRWKAIQQPLNASVRLYDLDNDIGEAIDLAADRPDLVAELTARMDASDVPSAEWELPLPAAD